MSVIVSSNMEKPTFEIDKIIFESSSNKILDDYTEYQAKARSYFIDYNTRIYIKDKKWWCPNWLYKKIIRSHVEVVELKIV